MRRGHRSAVHLFMLTSDPGRVDLLAWRVDINMGAAVAEAGDPPAAVGRSYRDRLRITGGIIHTTALIVISSRRYNDYSGLKCFIDYIE
ncbi:hypothetical protein D3C80_1588740 [compost metagenome]